MMEAVRTSETSVDNHSTRQYNPEDSSEQVIDRLLLRGFGPYGMIFMNVRVFISVAMMMLLRNFGPHEIIHLFLLFPLS
jgi:hypothetical protein